MSRTRWLIASLWLLLFWLIAGAVWLPALQRDLESASASLFKDVPTGYSAVQVEFSGQQATLTGKVRHESEKAEIEKVITHRLRTLSWLGRGLNPVASVHSHIEVVPYPSGWLMIAAQGARAIVQGTLATEYEARDVSRLLEESWAKERGRLTSQIKTDPARFDEAPSVQTTLNRLPPPRLQGSGDAAQIHLTRLGSSWERLTLDAPDELLRQQFSTYPISQEEWQSIIQPAITRTRQYQETERLRLAEAEKQRQLSPPHILLAARDQRLLLRGEIATLKIKRELLNTVITAFPDWRVLDDLRVNDQRRAVADFGPITTALLPQIGEGATGKSLALGLSGSAWQFVDWQVGGEAQPWRDLLPADLPPSLLQEDSRMVTQWLQGNAQGIPTLPIPAQPSFLTLTLLPGKVILAGQLAEEGLRTRLIEAARQTYGSNAVIFTEALLARGTCEPTADVEQTVRSLPALPSETEAPILAFALPGQVWKQRPASPDILTPGALTKSGLTPSGFPATMAEDTFAAEAYDHLRHHWRKPPSASAQQNPSR